MFMSLLVFYRKQLGHQETMTVEVGWLHRATVPCRGGSQPSGRGEGPNPQPADFLHTPFFLTTVGGLVPNRLTVETGAPPGVAGTPNRVICAGCDQTDKRGRENQEDRRPWAAEGSSGGSGQKAPGAALVGREGITHCTSLGPAQTD